MAGIFVFAANGTIDARVGSARTKESVAVFLPHSVKCLFQIARRGSHYWTAARFNVFAAASTLVLLRMGRIGRSILTGLPRQAERPLTPTRHHVASAGNSASSSIWPAIKWLSNEVGRLLDSGNRKKARDAVFRTPQIWQRSKDRCSTRRLRPSLCRDRQSMTAMPPAVDLGCRRLDRLHGRLPE
jgi:hypothetical protein